MRRALLIARMRATHAWDRARLRMHRAWTPGLEIDPAAGAAFAVASLRVGPRGRLVLGPGVVTDRIPGRLRITVEEDALIEIGAGTWLRTEVGDVHIVAFAGARIRIGPDCLLNGCHLSAKQSLEIGRRSWVGPGTRVFDSDQHAIDSEHPERRAPVRIGDHVWVSGDCTVLRGVTIGDHSVVGARSLVTRDIPPHTLAHGHPAEPRGTVGDRSQAQ